MKLDLVQVEALKRSAGKNGFAFFMEQGLGKTITCLADFNELVVNGGATRMTVLCPNSFKSGWQEEVHKHGFDYDVHVYTSGNTYDLGRFLKKDFGRPPVMVINYEAVRMDSGFDAVSSFVGGRNGYIAADESIQLKSHDSLQTKAALRLTKEFKYARILSGKPVTSGPHDLWAQMRFIKQFEGRNFYAFKTAFCKMGGFKMKQVMGAQNEDVLEELLRPHVFRATKEDWTDLPPKRYHTREYNMGPEITKMYKQMENEFVLWLGDQGDNVTVDAAITKYLKLAQIQAGFIIKEDSSIVELVPPDRNPRVKALLDTIETEVVGKFSVPFTHKYSYEVLSRALAPYRPANIRGGMTPDEIDAEKLRFNNDSDCKCILLQIRASKYGHTLLGQPTRELRCATQLFFENTYSLDDRSQIEDRHHRRGQTADMVNYVDFVGSSLDREAIKALQRKENVFQAVFRNIRGRA